MRCPLDFFCVWIISRYHCLGGQTTRRGPFDTFDFLFGTVQSVDTVESRISCDLLLWVPPKFQLDPITGWYLNQQDECKSFGLVSRMKAGPVDPQGPDENCAVSLMTRSIFPTRKKNKRFIGNLQMLQRWCGVFPWSRHSSKSSTEFFFFRLNGRCNGHVSAAQEMFGLGVIQSTQMDVASFARNNCRSRSAPFRYRNGFNC